MGGNPWQYFTPYQRDINEALQNLREQEFRAGRYGSAYWLGEMSGLLPTGIDAAVNVACFFIKLNQSNRSNRLIRQYGSIQAAIEVILNESMPDGTQSILDMTRISAQPEDFAVCPLSEDELREILGTTQPTRRLVEALLLNEAEIDDWHSWQRFWESIGRGTGRYIVLYQEEQPTEIFIAGYSFD